MISLAQVSVVLRGETFQRLSLCFSPARPDSISQSPWRRFWKTEASQTYLPKTLKNNIRDRGATQTNQQCWPNSPHSTGSGEDHRSWQHGDLSSLSATDWEPSASFLTSLCSVSSSFGGAAGDPCCTAWGILVPRPGMEPVPPASEAQSLNHWTTKEVPSSSL